MGRTLGRDAKGGGILLVLYVTIFPWNDFFSYFKEDELKRKRRGDHIRQLRHGRKREKKMEQRKKRIQITRFAVAHVCPLRRTLRARVCNLH
jgi:hypothetical protein